EHIVVHHEVPIAKPQIQILNVLAALLQLRLVLVKLLLILGLDHLPQGDDPLGFLIGCILLGVFFLGIICLRVLILLGCVIVLFVLLLVTLRRIVGLLCIVLLGVGLVFLGIGRLLAGLRIGAFLRLIRLRSVGRLGVGLAGRQLRQFLQLGLLD